MPNGDKPVKWMEKPIFEHNWIAKYPLEIENLENFDQ